MNKTNKNKLMELINNTAKHNHNYHASASVRCEIHAYSDLIHETVYQHPFISDGHDKNKTNCHASASVRCELHAYSNLICEMIYQHPFLSEVHDDLKITQRN